MAAQESRLGALHEKLAERFIKALDDPECPAAILAVAAKFLKDNGIECAPDNDKMQALKAKASAHTAFPYDPTSAH